MGNANGKSFRISILNAYKYQVYETDLFFDFFIHFLCLLICKRTGWMGAEKRQRQHQGV